MKRVLLALLAVAGCARAHGPELTAVPCKDLAAGPVNGGKGLLVYCNGKAFVFRLDSTSTNR